MNPLAESVLALPGIGENHAELFATLGVRTLGELLHHFPSRYEDRASFGSLRETAVVAREEPGRPVSLILQCVAKGAFTFQGREVKTFRFSDGDRELEVAAFNPSHRFFKVDEWYRLSGKVKIHRDELQLALADFEAYEQDDIDSLHHGRIVPIYPATEGLAQKKIRAAVAAAFEAVGRGDAVWAFPESLSVRHRFSDKRTALHAAHFPETEEARQEARRALVYEEFYRMQDLLARKRLAEKAGKESARYRKEELLSSVRARLPFTLTVEQETALSEILSDLDSPAVMQRLLHGEVGSGKTIVALLSMAHAAGSGRQAALLAPTEILARQHHRVFRDVLAPLGIEPVLLTGSVTGSERTAALERLRSGRAHLAIGTHALLSDGVEFLELCYVVIDEQHRFGLEQREALRRKGAKVDTLHMSATPIPKSLALTVFGDLDVSVLSKGAAPSGRKTKVLGEEERPHAVRFLFDRIRKGERGYVVYPAIEGSKKTGMKSLVKDHDLVKQGLGATPTGFVHGGLSDAEVMAAIEDFRAGRTRVLFSTTVIEVGIHVDEATVMIVEGADRFGLSQLHQLRGRVGRSGKPGFVYLLTAAAPGAEARRRLDQFAATEDGFSIAQLDLEIRGPGDFATEEQSGRMGFRLADPVADFELLTKARSDAQEVVLGKKGGGS